MATVAAGVEAPAPVMGVASVFVSLAGAGAVAVAVAVVAATTYPPHTTISYLGYLEGV